MCEGGKGVGGQGVCGVPILKEVPGRLDYGLLLMHIPALIGGSGAI